MENKKLLRHHLKCNDMPRKCQSIKEFSWLNKSDVSSLDLDNYLFLCLSVQEANGSTRLILIFSGSESEEKIRASSTYSSLGLWRRLLYS